MSKLQRVGDLEVEQDLDFARRDWQFQRVGMAVVVCGLILVALGFTGSGWFARGEETREGLRVRYNRFPRRDTETEVFLTAQGRSGVPLELQVALSTAEEVRLVAVTPQPESMSAGPKGWLLEFRPPQAGPLAVSLTLLPRGWGRTQLRFRLPSGPEVATSQFVWF